jgi:signal transduction histidine kinase
MAAGQTGWRRISPRRLAAFLGQKEPRPVPSRAARRADAAIAAVATIAALVAAIGQFRMDHSLTGVSVGPGAVHLRPVWLPGAPLSGLSPWMLLGVALTTAPLAFRRTYPITTFWVILAAIVSTSGSTHTTITWAAVIFAAYCAVAYSPFRRLALAGVLAAAIVVTAAYPDTAPPVPARFGALLVLLPTVAVGVAIRTWRRRVGESAERLRRVQQEHEAETHRAVQEERARIAGEMHDVVTHNVSVMVVQAGAARRVLDSSPGEAREALLAVEASGRTAMTELRHLLGLLAPSGEAEPDPADVATPAGTSGAPVPVEAGDAALTPQPGVARIPALLARVCEIGMPVELTVDAPAGIPSALPPGIDLAAFRVVQEALTNVMKHAGPVRTTVRLQYRPRDLLITVSDDGPPPDSAPAAAGPGTGEEAGPGSDGRGLIGLRERIAVYGGEIDAGPRPGGGWRLTARIPLETVPGDLPVPPEFQGVVP